MNSTFQNNMVFRLSIGNIHWLPYCSKSYGSYLESRGSPNWRFADKNFIWDCGNDTSLANSHWVSENPRNFEHLRRDRLEKGFQKFTENVSSHKAHYLYSGGHIWVPPRCRSAHDFRNQLLIVASCLLASTSQYYVAISYKSTKENTNTTNTSKQQAALLQLHSYIAVLIVSNYSKQKKKLVVVQYDCMTRLLLQTCSQQLASSY